MARPRKEGMDYFPHDTDASNDEKIESLRLLYGNDGYAFYFILLERIYRAPNFELDVSDAETIQILAKKVDVTTDKFEKMLETALKRGCFDREEYEKRNVLTSNGIKKRSEVVTNKRKRTRQKYRQNKENGVSDTETNQKPDGNGGKESKGKENKEEESKVKQQLHDDAAAALFQFYENNFGILGSHVQDVIGGWLEDMSPDLILEAMKRASTAGKRFNYADAILEDWYKRGVRTMEDVKAQDVEWKKRSGKPNRKNKSFWEIAEES